MGIEVILTSYGKFWDAYTQGPDILEFLNVLKIVRARAARNRRANGAPARHRRASAHAAGYFKTCCWEPFRGFRHCENFE